MRGGRKEKGASILTDRRTLRMMMLCLNIMPQFPYLPHRVAEAECRHDAERRCHADHVAADCIGQTDHRDDCECACADGEGEEGEVSIFHCLLFYVVELLSHLTLQRYNRFPKCASTLTHLTLSLKTLIFLQVPKTFRIFYRATDHGGAHTEDVATSTANAL